MAQLSELRQINTLCGTIHIYGIDIKIKYVEIFRILRHVLTLYGAIPIIAPLNHVLFIAYPSYLSRVNQHGKMTP